jgi:hypothetical protein
MLRTTYAQHQANRHAAGGQTQTEATEQMSNAVLRRASVGFLNEVDRTLLAEALASSSTAEYLPIRDQQRRVRNALALKGAL